MFELEATVERKTAQLADVRAENREKNAEVDSTIRQGKSRATTLEAELAVAKAESSNCKTLLAD